MVSISPKIEQEVLSLPVQERLALIDKLIESQNFPKDTIIDDIWADIAEKRLLEINEGLVSSVSGNEIFSK